MTVEYDAVVVGSGPNGLAAAITLARAGLSVHLYEAKSTIGGGMRTAELTLPGFKHDVCSAIHSMGIASPFFKGIAAELAQHGLEWIQPTYSLAHPFDDGTAALLAQSLDETADSMGVDSSAYRRFISPVIHNWDKIVHEVLGPLRLPPKAPIALSLFGLQALRPATNLARWTFKGETARGYIAGLSAHSIIPLERIASGSFALMFAGVGHVTGWPFPKGGSQSVADAMGSYFRSLGGEITVDCPIHSLDELPRAKAYLMDVTPRQLADIAGDELPARSHARLNRFRYGPGVFKLDWALSEPIPWTSDACRKAGTIHVGGTLDEIAASERAPYQGQHSDRPFVLVAQQSDFDATRAPDGKRTAWAYCHVPNGSTVDMTEQIENQIERFAPGFKDVILKRHKMNTADYQAYNPNYIGGDIVGGVQDLFQLFTRPMVSLRPYTTGAKGVYLCSSSTPPGGGVHGMCGYFAARSALWDMGKR